MGVCETSFNEDIFEITNIYDITVSFPNTGFILVGGSEVRASSNYYLIWQLRLKLYKIFECFGGFGGRS